MDSWWDELGRPDPYVVIEAAAGSGTLAASVLAAAPHCAPALRYVLVERSAELRATQVGRIPLEPPAFALGPMRLPSGDQGGDDMDPSDLGRAPGAGPLATSLAALPAGPLTGVVFANELLDNLAFGLCERMPDGWAEVRVGDDGGRLVEVLVPASPELSLECDRLAPSASRQARIPVQRAAAEWVRSALDVLDRGRVVAVDYASTLTSALAARPWHEWVRTYRGHGRGGHPLERPGEQDITCEVAVDQLDRVAGAPSVSTQSEFLARHGLAAFVDEARRTWSEHAAAGDLVGLAARSRAGEAAALTDPEGLGGFHVLEWEA